MAADVAEITLGHAGIDPPVAVAQVGDVAQMEERSPPAQPADRHADRADQIKQMERQPDGDSAPVHGLGHGIHVVGLVLAAGPLPVTSPIARARGKASTQRVSPSAIRRKLEELLNAI